MHKKRIKNSIYYYTSVRENGRVKTIYLGGDRKNAARKEREMLGRGPSGKSPLTYVATLAVLFLAITFGAIQFSGFLVLTPGDYGETPSVSLVLQSEDFLPSDSMLKITLGNQTADLSLYEFVEKAGTVLTTAEGTFNYQDSYLKGSGEGFGMAGSIDSFPDLSFEYNFTVFETIVENITINRTVNETVEKTIALNKTVNQTEEAFNETKTEILEWKTVSGTVNRNSLYSMEISNITNLTGMSYSADLIPGSVREGNLSIFGDVISVWVGDGNVFAGTDYSETIEGYGEGFPSGGNLTIDISLEDMGFELPEEPGTYEYSVVLSYSNSTLVESTGEYIVPEKGITADSDGDGAFDLIDCMPEDPEVYPGAAEECNLIDDNCNGIVDEGCRNITEEGFKLQKIRDSGKITGELKESILEREEIRVIVKFRDESQILEMPEREFSERGKVGRTRSGTASRDGLIRLAENPDVESVHIDQPVSLLTTDSIRLANIDEVQDLGLNGSGIKVCLVDTGVDYSVVDNYDHGYDFVNGDDDPMDDNGHGTRVGSIIDSVAPGSRLIVAKVMGSSGQGYESDVLEGLEYCKQEEADIISLSIGAGSYSGFCDSNPVAEYVNQLVGEDVTVIAATGNDGSSDIKSPSCASDAIRVSSTDKSDTIAGFSNVNYFTDLFAPGKDIKTRGIGGSYVTDSGTSLSVPFVSGVSALLLENESLDPDGIKYRLRSTGEPVEYEVDSSLTIKISRIDAYNAIKNVKTMDPYDYIGVPQEEGGGETYGTLSWWNVSFTKCRDITISNAGSSTLTDFPAYINLTYDSDMQSDFDDIRIISNGCGSGGSLLDYEIENHTSSVNAHLWVKLPSLPSGGTTISVYYGNENATSKEDPANVWSNSYTSVYHLDHTSGTAVDELGNFDATCSISPESNMNTSGVVGRGDYFDGDDGLTGNPEWNVDGAHTYCAWINYTTSANDIILEDGATVDGTGLGITSGKLRYGECNGDVHSPLDSASTYNDSQWHYVCGGHDGTVQYLYVDGEPETSNTFGNGNSGSGDAAIGRSDDNGGGNGVFDDTNTHLLTGTLDEIRISSVNRSIEWINQSYQIIANQGTFVTIGDENSLVSLVSPPDGYDAIFSSDGEIDFQCFAYMSGTLENISLYTNFTGSWEINQTNTLASNGETVTFTVNLTEGNYLWNCRACDSSGCQSAPANYTMGAIDLEDDFTHCRNVSISNAGSSTLTDFPVYVYLLHSPDMQSDFDDLRFVDDYCDNGGVVTDYEIENYTESTEAHVWVKIPSLPSEGTTISVYYGNSSVSSGENAAGVWDDNYVMVHHLQETDIDGGLGDIKDSTSNGNNGTTQSMESADQTSGKIDGSFNFDNTNTEFINVSDSSSLDTVFGETDVTLEAWVYPKDWTNYRGIITKKDSNTYNDAPLGLGGDDNAGFKFVIGNGASANLVTYQPSANNWYHVAGVCDGSDLYLYVNGNQEDTTPLTITPSSNNDILRIADFYNQEHFYGQLDEVRVSNTSRSADWVNQTYHMIENKEDYVNVEGWWNDYFPRCRDITISNSGSETLTDFPAYINLSYDDDMQADFDDVRFVDRGCREGGYILDYEVENYTASSHAHMWVRIPSIPSGGTTISVYYGNESAVSVDSPEDVWDNNYKWVYHFNETSGSTVYDSTSGNRDASESPSGVTQCYKGYIGDGIRFSAGYLSDQGTINFDGADYTISLWLKVNKWNNLDGTGCPASGVYARTGIIKEGNDYVNGYIDINNMSTVGMEEEDGDGASVQGNSYNERYTFHYFTIVTDRDAATKKLILYKNGVEIGSKNDLPAGDLGFDHFGRSYQLCDSRAVWDEFRIENTVRSADYINLTYQLMANQDDIVSTGEEEIGSGVLLLSPTNGSTVNNNKGEEAEFKCYVYMEDSLENVSLYGNFTGSWEINQTNSSVNNDDYFYFNVTLPQGEYEWACGACDSDGVCEDGGNYTAYVDWPVEISLNTTEANSGDQIFVSGNVTYDTNPVDKIFVDVYKGSTLLTENNSIFGTGNEGELNVSSDMVVNINTSLESSASADDTSLNVTETEGFGAGDELMIIQMIGSDAGTYEFKYVDYTDEENIYLTSGLDNDYSLVGDNKVQVVTVPHYTKLIIEDGGSIGTTYWDGEAGGVIAFRAYSVEVQDGGMINATGIGYRGASDYTGGTGWSNTGESISGGLDDNAQSGSDGAGGGGKADGNNGDETAIGGGGGGSYGTAGNDGDYSRGITERRGLAGSTYGYANLSVIYPGSGGGAGGYDTDQSRTGAGGGSGGGIIFIGAYNLTVNGSIECDGSDGGVSDDGREGGGGSGGSILLKTYDVNLGSGLITASGGSASQAGTNGTGGDGRIRVEYVNKSGSTSPSADTLDYVSLDSLLFTNSSGDFNYTVDTTGSAGTVSISSNITYNGKYFWDSQNLQLTGIELLEPPDNDLYSAGKVEFQCRGRVTGTMDNISLYINSTGSWEINQTNSSAGNDDTVSFYVNLSLGSYKWNCRACSTTGSCLSADANYSLQVMSVNVGETLDPSSTTPGNNISVYGNVTLGNGSSVSDARVHVYIDGEPANISGSGDWWDSSWDYRQEIDVESKVSSTIEEHSILVNFSTAGPVNEGDMKSDCGDVRFVDSSGNELNHTVVSTTCGTSDTLFWVWLESLAGNSNNTIYAYYGNDGAEVPDFTNIDDDLDLYYHFDKEEAYGETGSHAEDFSQNNDDASPSAEWIDGVYGKAYNMTGSPDYISMGYTALYELDFPFTISLWAKDEFTFFSDGQMHCGHLLWYDGSNFYLGFGQYCTNNCQDPSPYYDYEKRFNYTVDLLDGEWHHYVGVMGNHSTDIRLYVDGAQVSYSEKGTATTIGHRSVKDMSGEGAINRKCYNGDQSLTYYTGAVDEVRVYSRNLTDDEVMALYNSTAIHTRNEYYTDSDGFYNFTFQGPTSTGSYVIKVNVTQGNLHGENTSTLYMSCNTGDDCTGSDICINGECEADCTGFPGYGCSTDSNTWNSSSAGTCLSNGTCDYYDPVRMDCGGTCEVGTDQTNDTCNTDSGDSCMSDAGGNFTQDGTCADDSGAICDTYGDVSYSGGTYYANCSNGYACDSSVTGGDYSRDGTCVLTSCCDDTNDEIAYSDSRTDTTLDHCNTSASYGNLCDDVLNDGVSIVGVIASTTSTCCKGGDYFSFGTGDSDSTPWENCGTSCTDGRTCYDIGDVGSGLQNSEAGICTGTSVCSVDIVSKSGSDYIDACSVDANECDGDVDESGYTRTGYCCGGSCPSDGSVVHGGDCCGVDALCNDTTPSSCRAEDSTCGYDDGQSCDSGKNCSSNLCIAGVCHVAGNCTENDGYGCSNDTVDWDHGDAGTCLSDGACDYNDPVRMDCGGSGTSSCQLGIDSVYDECSSSSGDSCDSDAGGGNYSQDGLCTQSGCDTSGHACYNDVNYIDDCGSCATDYSTDSNGASCDSSLTGGDYSVTGMCTYSSTCTASGSVVRIDESDSQRFKETCDSSGDMCDSSVGTGLSDPWAQDGVCAGGSCCTDEAVGTSECDCKDGNVTNETTCDNTVTSGAYSADGICANNGGIRSDENSTCDNSGEACWNGTIYMEDCDYCNNGDDCDTSISGGDYSQDGICVADGGFTCDAVDVCNSSGTLYGDMGSCNQEDACDSDVDPGYSANGIVFDNDGSNLCCNDQEDYEDSGGGNDCCYNGSLLSDGTSSGTVLCYLGEFYDCGGKVATSPDSDTDKNDCEQIGDKYCDADNDQWVDGLPTGCSGCTSGDDCTGSDVCIESWCRSGCSLTYDGYRCSDDSNYYNESNGGVCAYNTSGWFCDVDEVASNTSINFTDCYDVDEGAPTGAYFCNSSVGPGYIVEGICTYQTGGASLGTVDCDSSEACHDDTNYRDNCSLCSQSYTDVDACDPDGLSGGYSAQGYCVNGDTCATGIVYNDSGTLNSSCSDGEGEACDSDATGSENGAFSSVCNGICVAGNGCSGSTVCWDSSKYQDNLASCSENDTCDESVASCTFDSSDGIVFDNEGSNLCCNGGEDYEHAEAGGHCCYNGDLLSHNKSSSSILCFNGTFFDCGGQASTSPDEDSNMADCSNVSNNYCDTETNTWKDTLPLECGGCDSGDQCGSGVCIEGVCRAECNASYDGHRCSDDSSLYESTGGICARDNSGTWDCDEDEVALNVTYNYTDCYEIYEGAPLSVLDCDSDASGGFTQTGVCTYSSGAQDTSNVDCDSDTACFNGTSYRNGCGVCSYTTDNLDPCDPNSLSSGYSAEGICTSDGCSTGSSYNNGGTLYDGCTDGLGHECYSNADGSEDGLWSNYCDGTCVSGSSCDTSGVCYSGSTYYGSYSSCSENDTCDSDGGCGYSSTGKVYNDSGTGNDCCDTGESMEGSPTGNCCYDGDIIGNNTVDGAVLCYEGELYDCNDQVSLGLETEKTSCDRVGTYYCDGAGDGANTWKDQIAIGQDSDDCDGDSEEPYGEGHASNDANKESCESNEVHYDWGNGISSQNQGWRCYSWHGPYAAMCNLSQSSDNNYNNFTIYVESADEADNGHQFGYIYRVGDYDTLSDQTYYNDSDYQGNMTFNTTKNQQSPNIDENEGTYGDYYQIHLTMEDMEDQITEEKTFYLEFGMEEANTTSNLHDYEDPNNNEGRCNISGTFCVPIGYSAITDSDCCPIGGTTSAYPGKDDDGGNCISCWETNNTQKAGGTGDGDCENKCGGAVECDELSLGTNNGSSCCSGSCAADSTIYSAITWSSCESSKRTGSDDWCLDDDGNYCYYQSGDSCDPTNGWGDSEGSDFEREGCYGDSEGTADIIDGICFYGTEACSSTGCTNGTSDDGPGAITWADCDVNGGGSPYNAVDDDAYCFDDSADTCYYDDSDNNCDEGSGWNLASISCFDPGTVSDGSCYYDNGGSLDESDSCNASGCTGISGESAPYLCTSGSFADGAGYCYNDTNDECYYEGSDMCGSDTDGWDYSTDNCYDSGSVNDGGTNLSRCYWDDGCSSSGANASCETGELVTDVITCEDYSNWDDGAGSCHNLSEDNCHYSATDLCADDTDGWDYTTYDCDSSDDTDGSNGDLTESEVNSSSCESSCSGSGCCNVQSITCGSSYECRGFHDLVTNEDEVTNQTCYYSNAKSWVFGASAEASETSCSDGYDNDCDGLADTDDPDCICTSGDNCSGADLCINGNCRDSGSCSSYPGYGCSTDSNAWNSSSAGTCLSNGTCDYYDPVRMDCGGTCEVGTDQTNDTCNTDSGDSCMSDAGGNFTQDGICAFGATNNCDTSGFVCFNGSSIYISDENASSYCSEGDTCDETLTDGDFSAGTKRYDPDDGSHCDDCSGGLTIGEDGDCEEACGADPSADEKADDDCDGTSAYINTTCGYIDVADDLNYACGCIMTGTKTYSSYWNLGGETNASECCANTTGEWVIPERYNATLDPAPSEDDTACCSDQTDCNDDDTCRADAYEGDVDGDSDTDYCNAGEWIDCNSDSNCQTGYYCNGSKDCQETTVTVTFQSPTPANGSRERNNSVTINVSVVSSGSDVDTCFLEWEGTNETMDESGSGTSIYCYSTKPTTDGNDYTFNVYANNTVGSWGNETERTFRENEEPSQGTPVLNSTTGNNVTTDNLTCYNVSTSDNDNDPVTNVYNWYRNGNPLMILYMPFDTNVSSTGTGEVKDYSGHEKNGTLGNGKCENASAWTGSGRVGGSYLFDGKDDLIGVGNVVETETQLTVTAWVKPSRISGSNWIAGEGQSFRIGLTSSDEVICWLRGNDTDDSDVADSNTTSKDPISSLDEWYHVACVWDGSTGDRKIYVNGNLELDGSTAVLEFNGDSDNFAIGSGYINSPNYFNGSIDELRLYNHTLSQNQLFRQWTEGKDGRSSNQTIVSDETAKGDVWKCQVTPNDGYEDGDTENSTGLTILNSAPTTPTQNSPPDTGSVSVSWAVLNCSDSTDADGDDITYYYFGDSSDGSTLLGTNDTGTGYNWTGLSDDTTYYWKCLASDDTSNSSATSVWNFTTAINDIPVISANETWPSTLYTETDFHLNVTCRDPDTGDSLTVYTQPYLNDGEDETEGLASVTNGTDTLVYTYGSGNFSKGDSIIFEFWCGDGTVNTTKYNSTEITVSNSAPDVIANSTSPANVYTNTDVLLNLTCADDDSGDSLEAYVQVYLNHGEDEGELSESVTNGTSTLVYTYGYGNFTTYDNITFEMWCSDGTVNSSKYNSTMITVQETQLTNCTTGCLRIRTSSGLERAIFDKYGYLDIAGDFYESSIGTPNGGDFRIQNKTTGNDLLWVDDSNGDLRIMGSLSEGQGTYCNPPSGSFYLNDTSGNCVAYVDKGGNLWLRGNLNEQAAI